MRRARLLPLALAAPAALLVALAPSAGAATTLATGTDPTVGNTVTAPFGAFGFTTQGLTGSDYKGSYGEPSLAVAPDGQHVLISTPGCGVCYWSSPNDGGSWATTTTGGTGGGGDSELDFVPTPDGKVTTVSADLAIKNSYINTSYDFGRTFDSTKQTTAGIEQDRQWFGHSPDGTKEYLVYHDFALEAEVLATGTWNPTTRMFDFPAQSAAQPVNSPSQLVTGPSAATGARPGDQVSSLDQGANTFSGPILVGPGGKDLYVLYAISDLQSNASTTDGVPPFGPTRGVAVAHSTDGGATWTNRYAVTLPPGTSSPAAPANEPVEGAIFPWGTVGPDGTVYVLYNSTDGAPTGTDHFHQYYTFSKDGGATWSKATKLDTLALGTGASIYATGAVGAAGVLDVAWYQTDTGSPSNDSSTWIPHFAQVTGANTASPRVAEQALTTVPNHLKGICLQGILCGIAPGSKDRSLADFFELAVNPVTGMAEVAYADNARDTSRGEVVFARQTAGPSALSDSPSPVVPEAPAAALLPLAAVALLGAGFVVRRRRLTAGR